LHRYAEAYAWEAVPSKEDPARMYYWNAVSGATHWEKPAVGLCRLNQVDP
jgi:hypothetical protein